MASREVAKQLDRVARAVAEARTRLTLEVHAELVTASPVDTGFLRASFVPSLGEPTRLVGGSPDAVSLAEAAAGVAAVAASKDPRAIAYISNNAHYVGHVNAKTRHAGFIQSAVRRAVARVGGGRVASIGDDGGSGA